MTVLYSQCGWLPFGLGKVTADVSKICDDTTEFDGKKCVAKTIDHSICDPATTEFKGGKCVSKIFDNSICHDTTKFEEGMCKSKSVCDPLTTELNDDGSCVSSVIPRCPMYSRTLFHKEGDSTCVLSELEKSPNCNAGNFSLNSEGKCIYASNECPDEIRRITIVNKCDTAHHDDRNGLKYVDSNPKSCELLYEQTWENDALRQCTFDKWDSDGDVVTCKSSNAPVCISPYDSSTCTEHDQATLQNILNDINDDSFDPSLCCNPSTGQADVDNCTKITNFLDCACHT